MSFRLDAAIAIVKTALGGWKLGVLETAESGAPFTVITTANTTNAFPAGPLRPNLLRDPSLSGDQQSITRWFDTSAFAAPAQFTFGNSPRSGLRGAALVTTDVTLEKSFRFNEKVQIRSARRVLQPPESRQFQRPRSHARRGRFRCR